MASLQWRQKLRKEDWNMQRSRSFLALSVMFLLSNQNGQAASPRIHSFQLHPTSQLLLAEKDSQRHLGAKSWLHPHSNGVYASLPKESGGLQLDDFHAHRHLTRYERQYRLKRDIHLESNWDGVYRDHNLTNHRHLEAHEDPYIATPLNQGYGTHYVNLWVGSPTPQRKTVIVDTGSHYTAFPCTGCTHCGDTYHTDPFFIPSQSDTFRPLECNECIRGAVCKKDKCVLSQSYTEGSSWVAYLAEDELFCGGNDILDAADPMNQEFMIPFMFGCQTSETGLFVTQLADGIMGMSAHESTLPKRLYDLNKIDQNMFAICFQRQLGTSRHGVTAGVMTLGGVDDRLHSTPMVYAKNMAMMGWYTVYVKKIYMQTASLENNKRIIQIPMDIAAVNSGKGVIVDSGTTDTYLHKKLAKSFGMVWKKVTGKAYHHKPIILTEDQLHRLPTILVQCAAAYTPGGSSSSQHQGDQELLAKDLDPSSPDDVLIAIPPTSYMEFSPVSKMYTSRIYFTESQGGVLGANAMLGHNVLFDWQHGRVGFAKSTCEHRDKEQLLDETEEPASNDCILAEAALSETCLESLDTDQCEGYPDRILRGFESWIMVVTNRPTKDGISCERAAAIKAAYKGREKSNISCDEGGLCTEIRSCQLKCSDLPGLTTKAVARVRPATKDCEDSWSACDASCTQTRVIAELMSDGLCHEKKRMTRPCHTGACASRHPCHVPYTVRAIIGFDGDGANSETWSRRLSESLATTLVTAFQGDTNDSRRAFTSGDIRVVSTSPWVPDSLKYSGTDFVAGTKSVIEISIVNAFSFPADDSVEASASRASGLFGAFSRSARSQQAPQCDFADLYPLARRALDVKETLLASPALLANLGLDSQTIHVTVVSSIKKDDEFIPMGSFSAGFHTQRLRMYAHHRPFMAILLFLSFSFVIFGTCSMFELLMTMLLRKTTFISQGKESDDPSEEMNTSLSSEDDDDHLFEQLVPTTPEDELSSRSDRSNSDDILERFLHRATCTPPRKLKSEDVSTHIPIFEQAHSMDESFSRSVNGGSSPRKRRIDRSLSLDQHETEINLEAACRKLEYGRNN
jgi:hypothetical protein